MKNVNKTLLMILDGWGIGNKDKADIIYNTPTPNWDNLLATYPHGQLLTSGESVGLPEGVMGNSEVGHLNIGAGRVIYQDLVLINKEVDSDKIAQNKVITDAFTYALDNNKAVHLIGLVSDGGVHSMDSHLYKLCDITKRMGLNNVFIHALTDGRDTDPRSGLGFIEKLENHLINSNGVIASLTGRYYTMDRDKRWERVKIGYDAMVHGTGTPVTDMVQAVKNCYAQDITDEFITPQIKVDSNGNAVGTIKPGDVVFCFNYRTDRLREITTVLSQQNMPEHGMETIDLYYVTMTRYDDKFKNVKIVYDKDDLKNTLGEIVANNGLNQLRIAETEKYAHVTFFLSGGREMEFPNEKRIMISSPKVATYDLQPEMSAFEVTDAIVNEIKTQQPHFIALNFANGDMVGHTGIVPAIEKAVVTIDTCVGKVVEAAKANGYTVVIIADHGNADNAINEDGSANTAHSLNPVPCVIISDTVKVVKNGILADVAPTVLTIMGLDVPSEMTGNILI